MSFLANRFEVTIPRSASIYSNQNRYLIGAVTTSERTPLPIRRLTVVTRNAGDFAGNGVKVLNPFVVSASSS